ncbi:autophagy-related protein 13 homolog isoform X2 [Bacillus rossius redtenbacheri]|uniref:autophagy-related protein 13 homolog isoform X2 n=1 Tax=Bacillus rossius redtenbacheri TaxID=93214 RepID=UPI002FDE43C1
MTLNKLVMATVKLSIQDKKDLDKFTKFLSLKAAQIIVQSRLGGKVHTKCKPYSSGTDWDLPEVLAEAKKALCGELASSKLPLCVEISLRTADDELMMLETWCLGVLEQRDPGVKVTYAVYNRMGVLLKSLISVTRVTPAYKLSRRQGPDSYVICYRIYVGEPQLHNLGEGYKQVRVGQLCTPVGTIHLSVSYRTKMTISPQHSGRENSIMVKSDHFHTDLSPRHVCPSPDDDALLTDTIKAGAFADSCRPPGPEVEVPSVPFSSLLTLCQRPEPRGAEPRDEDATPRCRSPAADSCRSSASANEDFIMVDLKTPFAAENGNSDLGAFYRECQSAPPLRAFSEQPTLAEQVEGIGRTLEALETSAREYDDLLSSLCIADN